MIPQDKWPVHEAHCCPKHGCKYGDEDCPVVMGLTEKHNEYCEDCEYDLKHPDPIEVLEKLMKRDLKNNECFESDSYDMAMRQGDRRYYLEVIARLKKNPIEVIEEGIEQGWWKK